MTTLEKVRKRAEADAKSRGYYLNPDPDFLQGLLEGLKANEERYGYPSCPCRLASGKLELDRDIICPCDYRDPDVEEFGNCYCALYVSKDVFEGKKPAGSIPERRPPEKQARAYGTAVEAPTEERVEEAIEAEEPSGIKMKLWYCKQCGYVVYREEPPYICPICKAKRELFGEIKMTIGIRG
ncbi:MAG: ferredoxin-thioredoxin reductase catalytic domain-containing protein [Candidatus Lokiarchaeia archaeon]